ncbi:MAG: triose-phosphate isomerase [Brevinema sp.]
MMKKLIAGNWKMHKTIAEGVVFVNELKSQIAERPRRGVLLCVPATMIQALAEAAKGTNILIGAQNMHHEEKGAFTGELSPLMLKDAGATYVLVGHSERRIIFGECNGCINLKVKSALKHDLIPVLCIGESLEEREAGKLEAVLATQLTEGLKGISESDAKKLVIAYEPVWAIGTGKTASPQDADDAHAICRKILAKLYSSTFAEEILILYGGSVKGDNIDTLIAIPNISGSLVGGASLTVEDFTRIVNFSCPGHCSH